MKLRLAIVVSHPIQYYVPLYRRLAQRTDIQIKVFFTWHAGTGPQQDFGFKRPVQWDIPMTDGYDYELVPNRARSPGTHHFFGSRNPQLVQRILEWNPDAVHITGYALASHLAAIFQLSRRRIPLLFRGDSHLLDETQRGWRWLLKRQILSRIYARIDALLYVGEANREYYRAFTVPESKLFYCPHSIEVARFAEPNEELEEKALALRQELNIPPSSKVLLFAGKFEPKKQPMELMGAVRNLPRQDLILVMVGNGTLDDQVQQLVSRYPDRFRLLPFQNQTQMPIIYRLADILILPSAFGETWGLAVNEALASGRRALASDRVGCGRDLLRDHQEGTTFEHKNWDQFRARLDELLASEGNRAAIRTRAAERFDIAVTEHGLLTAVEGVARLR